MLSFHEIIDSFVRSNPNKSDAVKGLGFVRKYQALDI